MDAPVFRLPASPGTPLFPVSPERANRQQSIPQSPSLPTGFSIRSPNDVFGSPGRVSDVQGKVAQFNNLNKESTQKRKENEAALKRAVVGREEAESEMRRLREANSELKKQITEYERRERKVGLRLENKMEELHKTEEDKQKAIEGTRKLKETLSHSKQVYEKEIRRARKEAFKASSDSIRLHEELKAARDSEHGLRGRLESTKQTVAEVEKEAFSARYKFIEVEEELQKMREKVKIVEDERDILKTSLKEEEVARIAAEGRIPLPTPATPDEFSSPRKKRPTSIPTPQRQSRRIDHDQIAADTKAFENKIEDLKKRLEAEVQLKRSAEDLVDFMKLECQLKRCCCRRSEGDRVKDYVFDDQFDAIIAGIRKEIENPSVAAKPTASQADKGKPRRPKRPEGTRPKTPAKHFNHESRPKTPARHADDARPRTPARHIDEDTTAAMEPLIEFSPVTGTFRMVNSPPKPEVEPKQSPLPAEDPVPDRATLAPPLAPIARSESPSILSLSENTTSTKSPQDNCQILPPNPEEILPPITTHVPSQPSTPQKPDSTPTATDADLLSFTPLNPSTTFHSHFRAPFAATTSSATPSTRPPPPPFPAPLTHSQSYILSTTTTTTVPLAAEPSTPTSKTLFANPSYTAGYSPGTTKTREEALQSIERWRRGRSRSVVLGGTPRRFGPGGGKAGVTGGEGENGVGETPGKRDCSAPVPRVTREL